MRFMEDCFYYLLNKYRSFVTEAIIGDNDMALVSFESDGVVYYKIAECDINRFYGCKIPGLCTDDMCTGWYVDIDTLIMCQQNGGRIRKLRDDFCSGYYKPHKLLVKIVWFGPFFKRVYSRCLAESMVFSREERKEQFEISRSCSEL